MRCYLCDNASFEQIRKGVRDNPKLIVLKCHKCGLLTLDRFDHITDDFYQKSKMHSSQIDILDWINETENDDSRRFSFLYDKIKNKSLLDFGTGNGNFLVKSKNLTKNIKGVELEEQFKDYFLKKGIEVVSSLDEIRKSKFDLITAFHVFEHLKDPKDTLKKLKPFLKKNGEIVIEVPNSDDALLSLYKSVDFSNFTYWSQHLFLFNEKNLIDLVKQCGFKINFIKQIQRYPLSNHLYWLSKGLPNGQNIFSIFNQKALMEEYVKVLEKEKVCDTLMISIS